MLQFIGYINVAVVVGLIALMANRKVTEGAP